MTNKKTTQIDNIKCYYTKGGADPWTVVCEDKSYLTLSDDCDSPRGVSMWGHGYVYGPEDKEIPFDELPPRIREHVIERMVEEE